MCTDTFWCLILFSQNVWSLYYPFLEWRALHYSRAIRIFLKGQNQVKILIFTYRNNNTSFFWEIFFAFYQHVLRLYMRLNNYLALTSFYSKRKAAQYKGATLLCWILNNVHKDVSVSFCTDTPMHRCLFTRQPMVFPLCHFIVSVYTPTHRVSAFSYQHKALQFSLQLPKQFQNLLSEML